MLLYIISSLSRRNYDGVNYVRIYTNIYIFLFNDLTVAQNHQIGKIMDFFEILLMNISSDISSNT